MSPMLVTYLSLVVVVLSFIAIMKRVDVKLALLVGGFSMALLSAKPHVWASAFQESMVESKLITIILPVLGFVAVMRHASFIDELVMLITTPLNRIGAGVIPAVVLATFITNTALLSSAACGAAVGAVAIPVLMRVGVKPAMAAASVLAGAWGAVLSPGSSHGPVILDAAQLPDGQVIDVILGHFPAVLIAAVVVAVTLFAEAKIFKECQVVPTENWSSDNSRAPSDGWHVKIALIRLRALIPVLPLVLLLLTHPRLNITTKWLPNGLPVFETVIAVTVLAIIVARIKPGELVRSFYDGIGSGYGGVIGIYIAAMVFVAGMRVSGVQDFLTGMLLDARSMVPVAAIFGSMLFSFITGSGDAVAFAFNQTVTPQAADFGINAMSLGSLAWIGAEMGRCLSPVAVVTVTVAELAKVDPFEVAKRTAIPLVIGATAVLAVLLFW